MSPYTMSGLSVRHLEGLGVQHLGREHLRGKAKSGTRCMPLPREHGNQSAQLLVAGGPILTVEGPDAPRQQAPSGVLLVLGAELAQCLFCRLAGDSLLAQLTAQRGPAKRPRLPTAPDPHPGEFRVVDKTDLLEPGEERVGEVLGDVPIAQLLFELQSAARPHGELAEQDRPRHSLGVSVRIQLGRWALSAPSASHLVPVDGLEARLVLVLGVLLDSYAELLLDEPLEFLSQLGVVPQESA